MQSILPLSANRRQMLMGAAALTVAAFPQASQAEQPPVSSAKLPRWRGVNLLNKFMLEGDQPFLEWDFDFLAAFGFDYVRLPMDYRIWTVPGGGWRDDRLAEIDQAIAFARARNIHVTLCLHRAPGYCVGLPAEPLDLWGDGVGGDEARRLFVDQWRMFAVRYRDAPSKALSFNLINEPNDVAELRYLDVAKAAVAAIRAESPDRLIIADGRRYGREPTPSLASLHIAQSTHSYDPFTLTHYRAPWVDGSDSWPQPTWPLQTAGGRVDKEELWREYIEPWQKLEQSGVGVVVGEWGVYSRTPHDVTLAWMKDNLENWRKAGWGWCLWNLRGPFGIIDSQRADVSYLDFHGVKIDAAMLDLLRNN